MSGRPRRFKTRVRTSQRAEEAFGLPVIAEIPASAPRDVDGRPEVEVVANPGSEASGAYRLLHAAIVRAARRRESSHPDTASRPALAVLIASPSDEPARSY